MINLERIQAKARELARSGNFHGWRPIAFELRFEAGYKEAREWLHDAATQDELAESPAQRSRGEVLHRIRVRPPVVHVPAKAVSDSRISALRVRLASFKVCAAFKRHCSGLPGM